VVRAAVEFQFNYFKSLKSKTAFIFSLRFIISFFCFYQYLVARDLHGLKYLQCIWNIRSRAKLIVCLFTTRSVYLPTPSDSSSPSGDLQPVGECFGPQLFPSGLGKNYELERTCRRGAGSLPSCRFLLSALLLLASRRTLPHSYPMEQSIGRDIHNFYVIARLFDC
jgi:hypothetical protein